MAVGRPRIAHRVVDAITIGLPLRVLRTVEQLGYRVEPAPPMGGHSHQASTGTAGNGDRDLFTSLHLPQQVGRVVTQFP